MAFEFPGSRKASHECLSSVAVHSNTSKSSNSDIFTQLFEAFSDVDCISENDLLRSKMAEIRPDSPAQVRVILAPYRIQISEGEIDQIITHVKQIT